MYSQNIRRWEEVPLTFVFKSLNATSGCSYPPSYHLPNTTFSFLSPDPADSKGNCSLWLQGFLPDPVYTGKWSQRHASRKEKRLCAEEAGCQPPSAQLRRTRGLTRCSNTQVLIPKVKNMVSNHWCLDCVITSKKKKQHFLPNCSNIKHCILRVHSS